MFRISCSTVSTQRKRPGTVKRNVSSRHGDETEPGIGLGIRPGIGLGIGTGAGTSSATSMVTLMIAFTLALLLANVASASSFGFSANINFGGRQPVNGAGGVFGDTVWTTTRVSQGSSPIFVDVFGDRVDSGASVSWSSPGLVPAEGIQKGTPQADVTLMDTYLDSPSVIELRDLDRLIPVKPDQELVYSLIIYAYGGREGEKGEYRVGDLVKEHVDLPRFDGTYINRVRGNLVVFENLRDPNLVIETRGFGPMNAISLVYCLPGDFNGDGQVDGEDLAKLNEAVTGGATDSDFDVNFDGNVNFNDIMSWIKCSKGTCIGDVNLDGTFDSSDLVELFQEGNYETGSPADWTSGDWNGDGKFDSGDLLVAFQEGCYESNMDFARNPTDGGDWIVTDHAATLAVPEPSGWTQLWVLLSGVLSMFRWQRVRVPRFEASDRRH